MFFDSVKFSDPGGRFPNEDSCGIFERDMDSAWIVADGLGGHISGEIASSEAVKALGIELNRCGTVTEDFLRNSADTLNRRIMNLRGPLTTIVCAASDGKRLYYCNNGDSRFIFIRKGKVSVRSEDHSEAYAAYLLGDISYEEIPDHPAQNHLIHALGCEPDFPAQFYEPIELIPGDAFVLCSDGFWELLSEAEILRALKGTSTAEQWLNLCRTLLISRLKENSDNYTAVFVRTRA